jgi:hypothetical protein
MKMDIKQVLGFFLSAYVVAAKNYQSTEADNNSLNNRCQKVSDRLKQGSTTLMNLRDSLNLLKREKLQERNRPYITDELESRQKNLEEKENREILRSFSNEIHSYWNCEKVPVAINVFHLRRENTPFDNVCKKIFDEIQGEIQNLDHLRGKLSRLEEAKNQMLQNGAYEEFKLMKARTNEQEKKEETVILRLIDANNEYNRNENCLKGLDSSKEGHRDESFRKSDLGNAASTRDSYYSS